MEEFLEQVRKIIELYYEKSRSPEKVLMIDGDYNNILIHTCKELGIKWNGTDVYAPKPVYEYRTIITQVCKNSKLVNKGELHETTANLFGSYAISRSGLEYCSNYKSYIINPLLYYSKEELDVYENMLKL